MVSSGLTLTSGFYIYINMILALDLASVCEYVSLLVENCKYAP